MPNEKVPFKSISFASDAARKAWHTARQQAAGLHRIHPEHLDDPEAEITEEGSLQLTFWIYSSEYIVKLPEGSFTRKPGQ